MLQNTLKGPSPELRVEALLAEVVEHLVGGFEVDAGFLQTLLDLLELNTCIAAASTFLSMVGVILLLLKKHSI